MKKTYSIVLALSVWSIAAIAQTSPKYFEYTKQAENNFANKEYKKAAAEYAQAFKVNGWKAYRVDRYNAACAWTLAGNKDSAFAQLFKVANAFKYDNYERISTDSILAALYKDPRWNQL